MARSLRSTTKRGWGRPKKTTSGASRPSTRSQRPRQGPCFLFHHNVMIPYQMGYQCVCTIFNSLDIALSCATNTWRPVTMEPDGSNLFDIQSQKLRKKMEDCCFRQWTFFTFPKILCYLYVIDNKQSYDYIKQCHPGTQANFCLMQHDPSN